MGQEKPAHSFILSDLEVCGLERKDYIDLPDVFTCKYIPVKKENISLQEDLKKWPYLKEVKIPRIKGEISMLIGTNTPKALEPWQVINSEGDGPYAVNTVLGWVVNGPIKREDNENTADGLGSSFTANHVSIAKIGELLIQQYNADFSELSCEDKAEMSQEDHQFMQSVTKSAELRDGHYCIGLMLRKETAKMPNNRCIAEQRAVSLKRKLSKNLHLHEDYKGFMTGVIESREDGCVWYIPHHGVYHPKNKTIRAVFDCTATFQGISLNDQLLQ